jgi:hemerythrin-like domain-containing protein
MTKAVHIIWLEHANIASVLACLRYLVSEIDEGRWTPDFQLLADILDYMETFPEVMHHPKEEHYLFPALSRRRPEVAMLLERVHEEHDRGAEMLVDLQDKLEAYEADAAMFGAFRNAAREYVDFERRHMAREDRELIPLAMKALTDEDWAAIEEAFSRNDDPLFGSRRRKEFDRLFQQILELAPRPLGFGPEVAEAR